jgi:NAD(P)-dependent dehydrogenase (short-subunit alcohol dehydrogenase family)
MKEFKDKVAVITGAASGIGRALTERCAQEGMKVVLADIDKKALTQAEEGLKAAGGTVLAVQTDVSKAADIEALARKTLDSFGAVHLLCNNAGVGPLTSILESTEADWIWVMGANLWSVIHGVRIFAPVMIEQGSDGHIVNTASRAGLICGPGLGVYRVTKHAVVALSETLYHELAQRKAKVHVSVLCPSFVNTQIMDSERNRPLELRHHPAEKERRPEDEALEQAMRKGMKSAISPREVADGVFNAIKEQKFYIFPHPELKELVRIRMEDILQERNPTNPLP